MIDSWNDVLALLLIIGIPSAIMMIVVRLPGPIGPDDEKGGK